MITGVHTLVHARDPDAARAFFVDEEHRVPGQMTSSGRPATRRLKTVLPLRAAGLGREPVLNEVDRAARPHYPS